jgi:uncharacterized surface protein with fasciclin (FAS1) repeats
MKHFGSDHMIKTAIAVAFVAGFAASSAQAANIVQTAQGAGTFNTLLAAAQAAGLAPSLARNAPLTVFAPTDAAFRKLPAGTVENLLKPENRAQLRAILAYHVIPARIAARDVPHRPTLVNTLNGRNQVRAVRRGQEVRVDGVRVVRADIKADNGVIHVIDRVLIPGQRRH